jgi:flagellin FlaB
MGFWSRSHTDGRAQVGIGTLIVFIALVLVATVAAGVLINTAGVLQASSETAGQQSQNQVTNNLQIQSVVGNVRKKDIDQQVIANISPDGSTQFNLDAETATLTFRKTGSTCDSSDEYEVTFDGNPSEPVRIDGEANINVDVVEKSNGDYELEFIDQSGDVIGGGPLEPPVSVDIDIITGDCDDVEVDVNGEFNIVEDEDNNGFAGGDTGPATTRFKSIPARDIVDRIELTASTAPGAQTIAISESTISFVSEKSISRLTYGESGPDGDSFTARNIIGSEIELREPSDRVEITLDGTDISNDGFGLRPGESVSLEVTTQAGASQVVTLQVPQNLFGKKAVILDR